MQRTDLIAATAGAASPKPGRGMALAIRPPFALARIGRPRLALAGAALLLASACAQLPKPQLQAYTQAFQAARSAAEPMIADYAVAERAVRITAMRAEPAFVRDESGRPVLGADGKPEVVPEVDAQGNPKLGSDGKPLPLRRFNAGYATDFQLTDAPALSTIGMPPGADAMDRAFRGIAAYNDTLVALAENRNIDEARGQLSSIIGDIGATIPGTESLVPLAGPIADLVKTVLQPAIEAGNRERFKQLVMDGYPKVTKLIDLLRDHTNAQYRTTTFQLNAKAQDLPNGAERDAVIAKIDAWHAVFADYVTLLNGMETRLGELKLAVEHPRSQPILARAQAGAGELRAYADGLRRSITQLHAKP